MLAIDPTDGRLYAGTNSEGVLWSDDRGLTWKRPADRLNRGSVWALSVDHASGEIFAGTYDGFFRSSDRGATWTVSSAGLRSRNVLAIATDPSSPSTLYVGTAAAIYGSTDGGRSWVELKNELYVTRIVIDPRSPSTLYAATHAGVIKSRDGGSQWALLRMAPPAERFSPSPPGF